MIVTFRLNPHRRVIDPSMGSEWNHLWCVSQK